MLVGALSKAQKRSLIFCAIHTSYRNLWSGRSRRVAFAVNTRVKHKLRIVWLCVYIYLHWCTAFGSICSRNWCTAFGMIPSVATTLRPTTCLTHQHYSRYLDTYANAQCNDYTIHERKDTGKCFANQQSPIARIARNLQLLQQ